MRWSMTRILDGEVRELTASGVRVTRFGPTAHDLGIMGANFMDARRRLPLLEAWAA